VDVGMSCCVVAWLALPSWFDPYYSPIATHNLPSLLSFDLLQFAEMAAATLSTVQKNIRSLPVAYGGFANTITGYTLSTNTSWPYVYYPYMEDIGANVREITKVASSVIIPIVTDPMQWSAFVQANAPFPVSPVIFQIGLDGGMTAVTEPGQYFPVWQVDLDQQYSNGLEAMFINYDYGASGFVQSINFINATNQPLLSDFLPPLKVDDKTMAAAFQKLAVKFMPQTDPRSAYVQPIHASLEEGAPVVAYIQAIISWSKYFNNVLLKRSENIFCVVENNIGQVHTWTVNQTGSTYLGEVRDDTITMKLKSSLCRSTSNLCCCREIFTILWIPIYLCQLPWISTPTIHLLSL
jgi:hypothetical protein